jgi:hypothetical protein
MRLKRVLVTRERARLVDIVVMSLLPTGTLVLTTTRFFRVFTNYVATSTLTNKI